MNIVSLVLFFLLMPLISWLYSFLLFFAVQHDVASEGNTKFEFIEILLSLWYGGY